jgi:hypothetical protein
MLVFLLLGSLVSGRSLLLVSAKKRMNVNAAKHKRQKERKAIGGHWGVTQEWK